MQMTRKSAISHVLLAKLLIIVFLALVLSSLGLWVYYIYATPKATSATVTRSALTPTSLTPMVGPIDVMAQQYMNALLTQHYDTMWSLLHPQMQAQWGKQDNFSTYLKAHFQDYALQSFTLGQAKPLAYWIDPETMTRYDNVAELPISLKLTPKYTIAQLPLPIAQPDQLFQNLPFVIQQSSLTSGSNSQWLVLAGGPADPEAPILPPTLPISRVVQVPILMYHYISDVPTNDPRPRLRLSLSIAPKIFTQQLDQMKARGYHSITLNQLMNALYHRAPLPTKPVIFTFDDGYEDAYQAAYPILKAHGYTGMFYIITGKVGWQGQMSWPQMREMLANGMQMGSHTVHHVDMGQVFLNSPQQAQQELQLSMSTLQQQLDTPIQHFCYPNGSPFKTGSLRLRQSVVSLLSQDGYADATTDPGATGIKQSSQAPMALLRIRVDGRNSLADFMKSLPW
ncbi:MAG: hypothetical protein E6J34_07285 [Chloroflexi bacterium]|nr:MAG: hypothetical protein E6J34_07285 [Chloroflexota bacterium]